MEILITVKVMLIMILKGSAFIAGLLLYSIIVCGITGKLRSNTAKMPNGNYYTFMLSILITWIYIGIRLIWPGIL